LRERGGIKGAESPELDDFALSARDTYKVLKSYDHESCFPGFLFGPLAMGKKLTNGADCNPNCMRNDYLCVHKRRVHLITLAKTSLPSAKSSVAKKCVSRLSAGILECQDLATALKLGSNCLYAIRH
jgi:hypothetical protein